METIHIYLLIKQYLKHEKIWPQNVLLKQKSYAYLSRGYRANETKRRTDRSVDGSADGSVDTVLFALVYRLYTSIDNGIVDILYRKCSRRELLEWIKDTLL